MNYSVSIPWFRQMTVGKTLMSLLLLLLVAAPTGCVSVKPITQTNISQSWFDEEEVVGTGIPLERVQGLNGKKVFLNVHTTIADDEKIIRDVKLDSKEGKMVANPINVVGGVRKAVEERVRSRLQKGCGITFVESPEAADFKVDIDISKAGMDVLKSEGEFDTRRYAEQGGNSIIKAVSFLSIQTSVNGNSASFYNTIDMEKKTEAGHSMGFPSRSWSQNINGSALLGDRKLCVYASSFRSTMTYVVIANTMKNEGLSKLVVTSPTGQETEVSIDAQQMLRYGPASASASGDLQKLGEKIIKLKDQRLQKFAKYDFMYSTGQGLLVLLVHDYINQLQSNLK